MPQQIHCNLSMLEKATFDVKDLEINCACILFQIQGVEYCASPSVMELEGDTAN